MGWHQVAVDRRQAVREIVAPLAFDSKRQRTMLCGGSGDSTTRGNLSILNGGAWQLVQDLPSLARMDASLAYDSKRDRLVLFRGLNEQVFFADTWEYDDSDWKPTFMPGPSLRSGAAIAYDSARGVTILYEAFALGRYLAIPGNGTAKNGSSSAKPVPVPAVGRGLRTIRRGIEQYSSAARMKRDSSFRIPVHGMARSGRAWSRAGRPRDYSL
jgi:hypothetical protein